MAMRATQQPHRGGTTSCASRPSAGIDRAKRLISLKATGEQKHFLLTVGRGGARRPRPGGGVAIEMLFRAQDGARLVTRHGVGDRREIGQLLYAGGCRHTERA